MARSLKALATEVMAVQDACNLSGVVHSWSRAITDLRDHCPNGTHELNHHPINQWWASKVASLTGTQDCDPAMLTASYEACMALATTPEACETT